MFTSFSRSVSLRLVLATVGSVLLAFDAGAATIPCQRTIAKAGSQFVKAQVKALGKCEASRVKGSTSGPCPDTKAAASIAKAKIKLSAAIDKSCGGDDHVCGGVRTNEDTPSSLGWPDHCPNFGHQACIDAILDCRGIASCIACVGEATVTQSVDLSYDSFMLPSADATNKCQAAIGKATTTFFDAKAKALHKCWDLLLKGKLPPLASCIPPADGDGKYQGAIATARAKMNSAICGACGGADKECDGVDDLSPAAIGFRATCPAVTNLEGDTCGQTISDLTGIVACIDCVSALNVDCVDRLQLPLLAPYPPECSVCALPTPTGPCPTSLSFTADGPSVDLDTGYTGDAHDAKVPTNGRLTLAVSGCAGASQPTCGQCNVDGPLPNAGGIVFDNQRCADSSWVPCTSNGDCTLAGATGPCTFYFGAPLPLVAGGVASCIVNRVTGPVTGTVNIDDGTSSTTVPLSSDVYAQGGSVSHPCPTCDAGRCGNGPRTGKPCTSQGSGEFGDVSLDCPFSQGALSDTLSITLEIATNDQTKTLSAANPTCRGRSGTRCFCDTCNNFAEEACSTNADCPPSGGNPGICGGSRCIGGSNEGAPCALNSACPGGGLCNVPGELAKPNSCRDDTSTIGIDESLCQDVGGNEGICPAGPFSRQCSTEQFRTCSSDAQCNPSPGTCTDCLPGQTCLTVPRPCFTDNGVIGGSVTVSGSPDVPCGQVSLPTVGSFFCVAPISAGGVNAAAGLPGLGRIRIPGSVVVSGQ